MSYVQIILAALAVAKEFISYLKAQESCKEARVSSAKKFAKELKEARKNGDTTRLESVFGVPNGTRMHKPEEKSG